jgi:hypothetical protein
MLLIAHISKGSECYRCNALEGGATSSRNAVSRKSGTTVGTHLSPLISVRVGWVGVPSKMSADRPVTPVTVWKIGLHLKMIWDHGPGF